MLVTVSSGLGVTPAEIQAFDELYMTADARARDVGYVEGTFTAMKPDPWGIGELMGAIVRMYDLTGSRNYLDYFGDLAGVVLAYRDDRRSDPREEPFRGHNGDERVATVGLEQSGIGFVHPRVKSRRNARVASIPCAPP